MECACCHNKRRKLLCPPCATTTVKQRADDVYAAQRKLQQVRTRCVNALQQDGRVARARVAALRAQVASSRAALQELHEANARARLGHAQRRANLDHRRSSLAREAAGLHYEPEIENPFDQRPPEEPNLALALVRAEGRELADRLARERHRLVRGTLAALQVRARRRKGAATNATRWEIAGQAFPDLASWSAYASTPLNAALVHTCHLLNLVARHLDIMLPFDIGWRDRPHVGRPHLGVSSSRPFLQLGDEGRSFPWDDRPDLYVSSSRQRWIQRRQAASQTHVSQSTAIASSRETSLAMALSMLCYNVLYLARTQGVAEGTHEWTQPLAVLASLRDVGRQVWRDVSCLVVLTPPSRASHTPSPASLPTIDLAHLPSFATLHRHVRTQLDGRHLETRHENVPRASSSRAQSREADDGAGEAEDAGWSLV